MAYRSLEEARAALGGRESRKIANNTYLLALDGGEVGLRLHATTIIVWRADGSVLYDTNGYTTDTTKRRLSDFGPFGVWQRRGQWYTTGDGGDDVPFGNIDAHAHLFSSVDVARKGGK